MGSMAHGHGHGHGTWNFFFFGSSENRSPSIARMARGIGTSVYSSPKAFPSLQSDNSNVLSALAASAAPPGGQLKVTTPESPKPKLKRRDQPAGPTEQSQSIGARGVSV